MTSHNQNCCVCLNFFHSLNDLSKEDDDNLPLLIKLKLSVPDIEWCVTYQICEPCTNLLNIVHMFRETCIKSDIIRKQQLEAINEPEPETLYVKPEYYQDNYDGELHTQHGKDESGNICKQLEAANKPKAGAIYVKSEVDLDSSYNDMKEDDQPVYIKLENNHNQDSSENEPGGDIKEYDDDYSDEDNDIEAKINAHIIEDYAVRPIATDTPHLLPEKSRTKYNNVYKNFMDWRSNKNLTSFTENVLLTYFSEISNKYKSSSLWTFYSMLRITLNKNDGINIENYSKLRAYLKRKSENHVAKKAKTFTPEQLNHFLNEAPDDNYLATKVALIMGIMGGCHAAELHSMEFTDLEDTGSILTVSILNARKKFTRKFTITGNFYNIVKKYLDLRPKDAWDAILFYKFQNGKYHSKRIGINKFGGMGKDIAAFLKLPDSNLYTGHCFRRSSTALLAGAGPGMLH